MPRILLNVNLRQFLNQPEIKVEGQTLLECVQALDVLRPRFSSYILEDDLRLRKHVNLFVDGQICENRQDLNVKISDDSTIHIIQALSGG